MAGRRVLPQPAPNLSAVEASLAVAIFLVVSLVSHGEEGIQQQIPIEQLNLHLSHTYTFILAPVSRQVSRESVHRKFSVHVEL